MGQVYRDISAVPQISQGRAITLGSFDGLHLGHRELLRRLTAYCTETGLSPLVVTFDPHPKTVISPTKPLHLILTPEEEIPALEGIFDGDILVLRFDRAMQAMTAEEFMSDILIQKLGLRTFFSGESHAIGKNREGDIPALRELAKRLTFTLTTVPSVVAQGQVVSSSAIRTMVAAGDIPTANALLGDGYFIAGDVFRGLGLGRMIGYPTANIAYDSRKALPKEGIYATQVEVSGERFGGMLFVGRNHMDPAGGFSVEGNIFAFDQDIYGERIAYYPMCFVRENRVITTREDLIAQMSHDKEVITSIIQQKEKSSVF